MLVAALAAILVARVVNGLTPYFGYKYPFSFSMRSNLTADGVRWNSLVVPRWLRLVHDDPFVEVVAIHVEEGQGRRGREEMHLFEAYWPPHEFARRARYHLWLGNELHLSLRYGGEDRVFASVSRNPEFQAFL